MTGGKKGRPRKNGNLFVVGDVLLAYHRHASGLGRNAAITKTVSEMRSKHPAVRLSATEVKKILAEWQPADGSGAFHVSKIGETYTLTFGRRKQYRRAGSQISRTKITEKA